jgi:branched-chain amino acid transport system permease protein
MVGGLAGPFFAARFGAVDPTSFTYQTSIQILIVVVLGGMGSLPGMLLGALVVVALPEALRFISDFRLLVFALGLIALMLVRPSGLWPVSSGARRHKERVGGHQPVAPPPIERGSDGDDFLLRVEHLKRWFGGVKAVDDVTFGIRRGEVLSIIGPNGAGKTTVFNCITGVTKASQGVIQMSGTGSIRGRSAHRIVGLGLARTFQGIRLFNGMTVAENVLVGMYAHRPRLLRLLRRPGSLMVSHRREHQEALYWLEFVGLRESADNLASQLSYGERRKLEVARALASGPQVLLLDEPAAGTNATEKQQLMKLVQQVRTSGVAVLLIEHDMNVVMGVSDRVMVMDHGRVICEGTPDHVQSDPAVIEAYLGRDDDLFAVADEPQEVAP